MSERNPDPSSLACFPVTTRFALRTLPMGFNSAVPWQMAAESTAETERKVEAPAEANVEPPGAIPPFGARWRGWVPAAVVALLGMYAALAFTASLSKGPSFDETLQLAVGYNVWRNGDFRVEGANGDLIKRWATLPYLVSQPNFMGPADRVWREGSGYELGSAFFFGVGNKPEVLLRQARAMNVLLGVATGLMIFWCARELFGAGGGLVSLAVFAFSPSMLALGGIVSTDMAITLTLMLATCGVWRLLHRITGWRLAGSLLATGLAVLAKPTALVLFPIALALVVVKLTQGGSLHAAVGRRTWEVRRRRSQAGVFLLLAALHVFAGWVAIWAHYDFRYAASPNPADPSLLIFKPMTEDGVPAALAALLRWVERVQFLPEGFWRGIDALLRCDDALGAFMAGNWRLRGGWASFFPYAIWVKSTPTLFLLLAAGGLAWLALRRSGTVTLAWWARMPRVYAATPLLVLVVCYIMVAMTEDINIGHRHALPIYPALYVLAGGAVLVARWSGWARLGLLAVLGWQVAESFAIRPHYLAYFGPQAGGPENGYKSLVDSSLDWGMDLPGLKRWLDKHDPERRERLFLAYFGTDRPRYYGIQATRLPGFMPRRTFQRYALTPGYYAISASLLQGVHSAAFGPWSKDYEELYRQTLHNAARYDKLIGIPGGREQLAKEAPLHVWDADYDLFDELRMARLCAWLRQRGDPPHHVGHALFIWKLSHDDLNAALMKAPVELVDVPARLRVFRTFAPIPAAMASEGGAHGTAGK